jgi:FkbM family methyltransferase
MDKIFIFVRKKLYYFALYLKGLGIIDGLLVWINAEFLGKTNIKLPNFKNPVQIRKNTTDLFTFRYAFILKEFEEITLENPNWIIDAGANVGFFSVYMKNKYPDSKVILIEPDPSNLTQCKKNLSCVDNVFFHQNGLWSNETNLEIVEIEEYGHWAFQVKESQFGSIKALSIEWLINHYKINRIDLLKIDIETSEKQVFSVSCEWLKIVKVIIIEFHDRLLDHTSVNFFTELTKHMPKYNIFIKGVNIVIINTELK